MNLAKPKVLALSLILAIPAALATAWDGRMLLAMNCPDRSTDPKCQNQAQQEQQHRQQEQQRQQQEQQRRQQEQQRQQQQEQQKAQFKLQEQERARAQQQEQQRRQHDQQAAQFKLQEQERARAQQQEQQRHQRDQQAAQFKLQEQERARAQQQEQQRRQHDQQNAQLKQHDPQGNLFPQSDPQHRMSPQGQNATHDGKPAADGRRPNLDHRPATPIVVNPATNVVPRSNHGFDIHRRNDDGSHVVISQKLLPDGSKQVTGYKQIDNSRDGTTTRTYSDGRRIVQGRDFERHSTGNGTIFVSRRDGTHEASLPDGRPVFRDQFTSYRDRDGSERRAIERIRYGHWSHGHYEYHERPVVRRYEVGYIYDAPVTRYHPSRFEPHYYHSFRSRFVVPVVAAVAVAATWAAFSTPTTTYEDPMALMGDMQISSGFEEGYAYAVPSGAVPLYAGSDVAQVRSELGMVQQQVSSSIQGDPTLRQQLGGMDVQSASAQVQQAVGNAVPVQISDDVRQQVRQQVRLAVAMHQNGRSMMLTDLLASGYANIYLFQTAEPINVPSGQGSDCFLNTGDLIGFATPPVAGNAVADMKVVASGSNSCRPGEVVQVRLTDLQEMLNGFSERVEDNMQKVSACAASGRC